MKSRMGFVSNSSSSSFLLLSMRETKTPEDWLEVFKPMENIDVEKINFYSVETDPPDNIDKEFVFGMIQRTARAMSDSMTDTHMDLYGPDYNFGSREIKDWRKMLNDKDFWLYKELLHNIRYNFYVNLGRMGSLRFEGQNLSEDIVLNIGKNLRYAYLKSRKVDSAMDDMGEYLTDRYIKQLGDILHEDSVMYYFRVSSDGDPCDPYFEEGEFMRFNFHEIIHPEIEFIKFEHS